MEAAASIPTHILVIPYPAQGHMTPLLDLTSQLCLRGLKITIVVTPKNLPSLNPLLTAYPSVQTLVLPFPNHPKIPPGVENIKDLGATGNPAMISALCALQEPIVEWFNVHPFPPCAVISDFFLGWTHHLALHLGIPRLAFFSSGAFLACVVSHLFTDMDVSKDQQEVVEFINLPHSPSFEWGHLPSMYRVYKASTPFGVVFKDAILTNLSSWGCIFNSFRYLEGEYMDHMAKLTTHGRVFGVGPVNLLGSCRFSKQPAASRTDHQGADNRVLDWLDSCPDGSVLYISFGSQKWLTEPQSEALAMALEQSGVRFFWVARAGPGEKPVPTGFEERVSDRGFVAKGWVAQVEVLNHKAVGGFLTHCGWNSILEGLTAGLTILAWPMEADQYVNAKLLTDDWGVAVRACEGADTIPEVDKLARITKEFMAAGETMQDRRKRVHELKGKAVEAVVEGGSSIKDLDEMLKELTKTRMQRRNLATCS